LAKDFPPLCRYFEAGVKGLDSFRICFLQKLLYKGYHKGFPVTYQVTGQALLKLSV